MKMDNYPALVRGKTQPAHTKRLSR